MLHATATNMNLLTRLWLDQITPDNALQVILEDGRALAACGFDQCEIPTPHLEPLREHLDQDFWRQAGEQLRAVGVTPIGIHGPNWPSPQAVEEQGMDEVFAIQRWHAGAAKGLGVAAMVVHPSSHTHPHVCRIQPRLLEQDLKLATVISDELGDSGVMLAIENLPTYSLAYLEHLLLKIGRSNVGVCYDTGHWHLRPEGDLSQVITRLGRYAGVYVHWSDNHGLCDEHRAMGEGTYDVATTLAAMGSWPAGAYRGGILELSCPHIRERADAADETRRIRQEAVQSVNRVLRKL